MHLYRKEVIHREVCRSVVRRVEQEIIARVSSTIGTCPSDDNVSFVRPLAATSLAAAVCGRFEEVQTPVRAIREDIVILDVFAHGGMRTRRGRAIDRMTIKHPGHAQERERCGKRALCGRGRCVVDGDINEPDLRVCQVVVRSSGLCVDCDVFGQALGTTSGRSSILY